jgi:hypothetical protein
MHYLIFSFFLVLSLDERKHIEQISRERATFWAVPAQPVIGPARSKQISSACLFLASKGPLLRYAGGLCVENWGEFRVFRGNLAFCREGSLTSLPAVAARMASEDPLWKRIYPSTEAQLQCVRYYPYDAYFRAWDHINEVWDREILRKG